MQSAPNHPQEAARIEALNEYQILDTLPEQEFDDLTQIAASICGTEIALVSLVDTDRQLNPAMGWMPNKHPENWHFVPMPFCKSRFLKYKTPVKMSGFLIILWLHRRQIFDFMPAHPYTRTMVCRWVLYV